MAHDPHAGFTGLDLRKLPDASDPRSARKAQNVDMTIAGGYRARDPFVAIATVDAKSAGLYVLGGQLRCAVPGGEALSPPPGIIYDRIGDGGSSYGTSIAAVTSAETIGNSTTSGIKPYLIIRRATGAYEHHWIQAPPWPISTAVNTKVNLPFKPGASLIKMASKLWAIDAFDNGVRYSSVLNGPTDWTLANDAGELPVASQVSGDRTIYGLGQIEGKLAVFLSDAVELWRVFADPTRSDFGLDRTMNGPGTQAPRSVVNVLGDLFYFSRGGFRSLKQNLLTGQFREGDLGSKIQPLTKDLDPTAAGSSPVAVWSQARQQYLCAFGGTVYALTYSNQEKAIVSGWTTWTTPAAVEYLVELDGEVYFRAGNTIYQAIRGGDPALETGYSWELLSQFFDQGDHHVAKTFNFLDVTQQGESNVSFYDDPKNPLTATGDALATSDQDMGYTPLSLLANNLSVGFTGTKAWQLEQFDLYYDRAGV